MNYPSTLEVKYSEVKPLELDGLERAEMINEEQLRQIMKLYGEDVWNYIYFLTKKTVIKRMSSRRRCSSNAFTESEPTGELLH
ncbi:hypothetical protein ACFTAO_38220 [Paenibacillus rhizoplanae]